VQPPQFTSEEEINALVRAFLHKELPLDQWTHEAHLATAIWHLKNFSKAEATHLLRCRIIEYNHAIGPGNSFASGYHETITLLWIWLLDRFIQENPGNTLETINHFLTSKWASGDWLFDFYSKERLASDEARGVWVEPDKRALSCED